MKRLLLIPALLFMFSSVSAEEIIISGVKQGGGGGTAAETTAIDEFTNSNATNVQDVLDDLDGAIAGGATTLVDIVATTPLLVDGGTNVDDAMPGADADVTFSLPAATNLVAGYATAAQITALEAVDTEAELEALLELQDLQGAVTDAQVPNTITVDLSSAATALAADGGDCAAGSYPLGVDASGAVTGCTDATTEIGTVVAGYQPLHAYLTDLAGVTGAQGNVLHFDGTDWVVLAPGVAGQFLKTGGAAADVTWDDPAGSGDITAVGDAASGGAFTEAGTGNSLYFEGGTPNTYEILVTGANPGVDVIVTIPAETGSVVLGPAGFGTDNRLAKTNGTGNLTQITGITVDDSNNISGVGTISSGVITADVTGALTGQADTVATIAGLAPDTATTQATQASITTAVNLVSVGALASGSLAAGFTDVPVPQGGTGVSTLADGGLVVGNAAGAVEVVAPGTTSQVLIGGGASTAPVWGEDIPTAVTIGTAYVYRVGGTDVSDADVVDTITASNYLPLAGGTLTGELVVDELGIEGQETDAITDCSSFAATGGGLFYDDSEGQWKKCEDNVLSDLDTTGGTPATADISDVNVTQTELAELEAIGATTISAAQWAGLGGATTAGIAIMDIADNAALAAALDGEDWTPTGAVDLTGTSSLAMGPISFEGSTADDYETTFSITDPTADRTIAVGDFDTEIPAATAVDATGKIIAAGMAANSVDSDNYVDASIDNAHLADSAVDTAELAADAVESTKIADNAVDTEHLADDAVTYAEADGSSKSSTPLADDADDFSTTFVGAYLYGGTFVANLAGDVDLPAPVVGMNFTVITLGDIEVDILPTAGDDLILDGEQLDDNHDASNTGSMGDIIVIQYYDADGWICTSNGWTEVAD